jgi:hypothetical protein
MERTNGVQHVRPAHPFGLTHERTDYAMYQLIQRRGRVAQRHLTRLLRYFRGCCVMHIRCCSVRCAAGVWSMTRVSGTTFVRVVHGALIWFVGIFALTCVVSERCWRSALFQVQAVGISGPGPRENGIGTRIPPPCSVKYTDGRELDGWSCVCKKGMIEYTLFLRDWTCCG